MHKSWRAWSAWSLGGALLVLAGAVAIVRIDIAQRRASFETDARIAHRLLSQRAAQHEAILATLVLLRGGRDDAGGERAEAKLPAFYPQLLAVHRRAGAEAWPEADWAAVEEESRNLRRAVAGRVDPATRRFVIVQASGDASFAIVVDGGRMVPWDAWPLEREGPVSVALWYRDALVQLQAGLPPAAAPSGLTPGFVFAKTLDSPSQPFELRLHRATGPAEWPWLALLGWTAGVALALAAISARMRSARERERAAAAARVAGVARLNAMGELAAGMAHEINQPLAAMMASTQAARRMLDDDPPEMDAVRTAMTQATAQARRAADVVARLRRLVQSPARESGRVPVRLEVVARAALDLLAPELDRRGIATAIEGTAPAVLADPVALEQIVHNLVGNAMQALDGVPRGERRIVLRIGAAGDRAALAVIDSGPGIPPDALARIFEPFYTTREGGLGLGLGLCESLAQGMDGRITAENGAPKGAVFTLMLPLAQAAPSTSEETT